MTRKTLTISKPRINLASLRCEFKDAVRFANDMNFSCRRKRNAYIARSLILRGHATAVNYCTIEDIANLVGLKVENGVIFA